MLTSPVLNDDIESELERRRPEWVFEVYGPYSTLGSSMALHSNRAVLTGHANYVIAVWRAIGTDTDTIRKLSVDLSLTDRETDNETGFAARKAVRISRLVAELLPHVDRVLDLSDEAYVVEQALTNKYGS